MVHAGFAANRGWATASLDAHARGVTRVLPFGAERVRAPLGVSVSRAQMGRGALRANRQLAAP